MRDYNAILFRSPKEKQQLKETQKPQIVSQQPVPYRSRRVKEPPLSDPSGQNDEDEQSLRKTVIGNSRESRQEGSTSTNSTVAMSSSSIQAVDSSPPGSVVQSESITRNELRSIRQQQSESKENVQVQLEDQHSKSATQMSADVITVQRDGSETTISGLRAALDEALLEDASSKTSLAKSDAIILELRSSVRQLKRQLEKIQHEKEVAEQEREETIEELRRLERDRDVDNDAATRDTADSHARDSRIGELQVQLDRAHAQILTADMVRKELEDTLEAEQYTWELRVQEQDRAIREWQDECRTLQADLEQCRSQWKEGEIGWGKEVEDLQNRLEKAQQEATHWKSMQTNGSSSNNETIQLKEKLLLLEQERAELQSCLDDALKELEAVDAELQNDNTIQLRQENEKLQRQLESSKPSDYQSIKEPLQQLYRSLLDREDVKTNTNRDPNGISRSIHEAPEDPHEIIQSIRTLTENLPPDVHDLSATKKQVQALESQLSVYRGDLKAREESSAELMASLKEAVGLLKPLQDAAAKADRERKKMVEQLEKSQSAQDKNFEDVKRLKNEINNKDDEIEELKHQVQTLELALSKAKLESANELISQNRSISSITSPESLTRAREDVRSRRQSEVTLKELLRDAQTRLNTLHEHNQQVESMNSELQGRLRQAEESILTTSVDDEEFSGSKKVSSTITQSDMEAKAVQIKMLQEEISCYQKDVEEKSAKLADLEQLLNGSKENVRSMVTAGTDDNLQKRVWILEAEIVKAKKSILKRKEAEKTLKRSLRDALGLLKPLQMHLEESEEEKRELLKEIQDLKQRIGSDDLDMDPAEKSDSTRNVNTQQMRDLENIVKQLESENSQLHDALEEMSRQSINMSSNVSSFSAITPAQSKQVDGKTDARLREELVEMKSRYEVTQRRLESFAGENRSLVAELNKVGEESELLRELKTLREQLRANERELENAKYIATSALVKVEELTMANVEKLSLHSSGFDQDRLYEEKAMEVDYEMNKIRDI
jgi:chromosome segregation ATPase